MQPIQDHTILDVLQYIGPPSHITQDLPPHLLSSPLLKRHHFLGIYPTDPVEYLCWPADSSDQAVHLLETAHIPEDAPSFTTRYTSDPEHTYAHVHIPSPDPGVRLIFQWEYDDGWKYHDLQLMPIPSTSFVSLDDALATHSNASNSLSSANGYSKASPAFDHTQGHGDELDEDSYWDAYGTAGENVSSPFPDDQNTSREAGTGEDAYWAQYSSVHGTADSTQPSPLPQNRRKLLPVLIDHSEPVQIPNAALNPKLGPPSPGALTHLLNFISPRNDEYSPATTDPESTVITSDAPSPRIPCGQDMLTPSSADYGQLAHVVSPVAVKINGIPLDHARERKTPREAGMRSGGMKDSPGDTAVCSSIRGIYCLWKAGKRKQANGTTSDSADEDEFLTLVRAAIASA